MSSTYLKWEVQDLYTNTIVNRAIRLKTWTSKITLMFTMQTVYKTMHINMYNVNYTLITDTQGWLAANSLHSFALFHK